jgi:hypothetical protein
VSLFSICGKPEKAGFNFAMHFKKASAGIAEVPSRKGRR